MFTARPFGCSYTLADLHSSDDTRCSAWTGTLTMLYTDEPTAANQPTVTHTSRVDDAALVAALLPPLAAACKGKYG